MLGLGTLARVAGELRRDVAAATSATPRPAASRRVEILAAWPGVHALLAHRVAHALHDAGVPVVPRSIAYVSRALTGIEIHPAARIGDGLFIDHGTGVVIGETAEIGNDVTLYQGVTLGGTGFATGKRHPTVRGQRHDRLAARSCSGPITVGHGAKIGANTRRHPRRPAEPHRRRQPRPRRAGRGPPRPRARTPTGSTCPTPSPTRSAALAQPASATLERAIAELRGARAAGAQVRPLRPARGPQPRRRLSA